MAITENDLTSGSDIVAGSSAVTASIAPAANRLVMVAVESATVITATPNEPTLSGGGMTTWTSVASIAWVSSGASRRRLTLFRALQASPGSGTVTIDFAGQSQDVILWSIVEFAGVKTSGANGADAVLQPTSNSGSGTSGSVTLAAFGSANNGTYGAFAHRADEVTSPGGGFTERHDVHGTGAGSAADALETEWRADNDTGVDASWATSVSWGAIAFEIVAVVALGGTLGIAAETEAAVALTHAKRRAVTLGAETETARPVVPFVGRWMSVHPKAPDVSVDLALTVSALDTPLWESFGRYADGTTRIRSVDVRLYRTNELDEFQTGELTVVLGNKDRSLEPFYAAGPYYPDVRLRRRIRYRARWSSVAYDRFNGFIRSIVPSWPGQQDATVTITAADYGLVLNRSLVQLNGFPRELAHDRIGRVLDTIGVPASERAIDTSDVLVEEVSDVNAAADNRQVVGALEHCRLCAQSDGGYLFLARDGKVTFHNRRHRLDVLGTPVGVLGDDVPTEMPYYPTAEPYLDDSFFANQAAVLTADGTREEVTDSVSAGEDWASRRDDFQSVLALPGDAASLASLLVARYSTPRMRVPAVQPVAYDVPGADLGVLLAADVGTRFTWRRRPPPGGAAIDQDVHVEGLTESAAPGRYALQFDVTPADEDVIAFDPGVSALDGTDVLVA
jgi:hypothetical protein